MENKYKFGYEDSDKKIEVDIYGLNFQVKELSKIDIQEIQNNKENVENLNNIDDLLTKMLGEDAIDRINEQRKKDGYEEMDLTVKAGILGFVFQIYCNEILSNVEGIYNKVNNSVNNMRNYNMNRRYKKYRKNRRY